MIQALNSTRKEALIASLTRALPTFLPAGERKLNMFIPSFSVLSAQAN